MARAPGPRAWTLVWLCASAPAAWAEPRPPPMDEAPHPASAMQMPAPLERAFLPDFPRDASLGVHFRSTFLDRIELDGGSESEALAAGGWIRGHSGWWRDALALEAALFTTQRLHGPRDEDGTQLLERGQHGFTTLGVANLQARAEHALLGEHRLVLGRQELSLPFVNSDDVRMTPHTFAGALLVSGFGERLGPPAGSAPFAPRRLGTVLGWIDAMRRRDRDHFAPMSEIAGASGGDRGLALAGLAWRPAEGVSLGALSLFAPDAHHTVQLETSYARAFSGETALRLELQLTDQRSVGGGLEPSFHTRRLGARAILSWRGASARLGFASNLGDHEILNPFGSDPSPTHLMQLDFERAGEDAWLVGAGWDLAGVGLPGVSGFVDFARGRGGRADDGAPLPDRRELDATLDWRPESPAARGLWLRARMSWVHQEHASRPQREIRLILNWDLPALQETSPRLRRLVRRRAE